MVDSAILTDDGSVPSQGFGEYGSFGLVSKKSKQYVITFYIHVRSI